MLHDLHYIIVHIMYYCSAHCVFVQCTSCICALCSAHCEFVQCTLCSCTVHNVYLCSAQYVFVSHLHSYAHHPCIPNHFEESFPIVRKQSVFKEHLFSIFDPTYEIYLMNKFVIGLFRSNLRHEDISCFLHAMASLAFTPRFTINLIQDIIFFGPKAFRVISSM